jgi:uncharacterized membrane protein YphA (DoxX/SURF4 family)
VSGSFVDSSLAIPLLVAVFGIPGQIVWSYCVGGAVFGIGLVTILLRGDWQRSQGLDKLILFGPIFYAPPLAAFGTEHFTITSDIASIVPSWIPWHLFWAYFVGACFIAAALSMVTGIQARLAASLVALTFFLFVALMDAPGWVQTPRDRFAAALTLRELSFSGGALALAAGLSAQQSERAARIFAMIARYFIAVPVLFYSFEQFRHADHVPGLPLELVTPHYVIGHAVWTYLVAAVYVVAGIPLLIGWRTRAAAAWIGLSVLVVEIAVYVPIAVMERADFEGINYLGDTLMYCGAVLLLAGAMPRETQQREH